MQNVQLIVRNEIVAFVKFRKTQIPFSSISFCLSVSFTFISYLFPFELPSFLHYQNDVFSIWYIHSSEYVPYHKLKQFLHRKYKSIENSLSYSLSSSLQSVAIIATSIGPVAFRVAQTCSLVNLILNTCTYTNSYKNLDLSSRNFFCCKNRRPSTKKTITLSIDFFPF